MRALSRFSYRLEVLLGERIYLLLVAALIGVLGGWGAVALRELVHAIAALSFPNGTALDRLADTRWYWLVLPPAVGGLVVGPLLYFFAREAGGHGIPEVMRAVSERGGRIRRRVIALMTVASAVTIGTGGSVGREGPIVQIGAGLGSAIGRALGFDGNRLIVLLGCGSAAGLAASFNAPLAGVLLTMELIIGSASISVFSPLVVASVAGTVVMRLWYGDETFMHVPAYTLVNPWVESPLYVGLGIAAGVVSVAFSRGVVLFEELFERSRIPAWFSPVLGGAAVGAMAVAFPHVLGGGYETMYRAVTGQIGVAVLAALVLIKILAVGFTLGSGASGGVFAPALFIGACLGGAYGGVVHGWWPQVTADSGAYALVGMGAVLAGTTHAPITAILMLFELSTTYTIILPLMLSCIVAVVIATRIMPTSIFTTRLAQQGVRLRGSAESELLRRTPVSALLATAPPTVGPATPLRTVIEKAMANPLLQQYVVDDAGVLVGEIGFRKIKALVREQNLHDFLVLAADVMAPVAASVSPSDTLDTALHHMTRLDVETIPVVDEEGRLLGTVARNDVMLFFEHEVLRDAASGMRFASGDSQRPPAPFDLPEGQVHAALPVTAAWEGKTLRALDWRATLGVTVVAVEHEGHRTPPVVSAPLRAGDVLHVVGPSEAVARLRGEAMAE